MKVGIVANEFFDQSLGRMGGFGWVAWAAARALREVGGMEAVFLTSELRVPGGETTTNGVRLLTSTGSRTEYARRLARERFDLLLTVDWRNNYRGITLALPRTPLLVWVQDPRTAFDVRRVDSLIAPGVDVKPKGIDALDCTGLRHVERASRVARRPFLLAGHARYLEEKVEGTYGLHPDRYEFLPDPVRLPSVVREESPEPTVLFLGRTDPIKRPWLFFELARRMPDVRFSLLGQAHFTGAGAWVPDEVPANLELAGHVGEEVKNDYLRRGLGAGQPLHPRGPADQLSGGPGLRGADREHAEPGRAGQPLRRVRRALGGRRDGGRRAAGGRAAAAAGRPGRAAGAGPGRAGLGPVDPHRGPVRRDAGRAGHGPPRPGPPPARAPDTRLDAPAHPPLTSRSVAR